MTRSGLASGLSILLIATMIGTPAARAWSIASLVCGMTPSSAATTRMTMSVTRAPRARISVNASWPGVSRKTTGRLLTVTWYAPMCCVMPPASRSATFVVADGVEQRRLAVVDVAHDGDDRGAQRPGLPACDSSVPTSTSSSSKLRSFTSAPNSRASDVAVSVSSVVLMVIMMRRSSSFFRMSFARTSSFSESSLTVMPSASVIVRVTGGGASDGHRARRDVPGVVAARAARARPAHRPRRRRGPADRRPRRRGRRARTIRRLPAAA